jgi:hypothetical protein
MHPQARKKLKFIKGFERLQKDVTKTGLTGRWRTLKNGQKQYRADDGGVLNWWPATRTILFQGVNQIAREELALAFLASARKRLIGEYRGQVFCGGMQRLYPDSDCH